MKRFISHYLYLSATEKLNLCVIDVDGGLVSGVSAFQEETACTVWLGGIVVLSKKTSYFLPADKSLREIICELTDGVEPLSDGKIVGSVRAYSISPISHASFELLPTSNCLLLSD